MRWRWHHLPFYLITSCCLETFTQSFAVDQVFRLWSNSSRQLSYMTLDFVPKGNVLGPMYFIIYATDVAAVAGHSVDHCRSSTVTIRSIDDIDRWMSSNRLKLNLAWLCFVQFKAWRTSSVYIGGTYVLPLAAVCHHGVTLDQQNSYVVRYRWCPSVQPSSPAKLISATRNSATSCDFELCCQGCRGRFSSVWSLRRLRW